MDQSLLSSVSGFELSRKLLDALALLHLTRHTAREEDAGSYDHEEEKDTDAEESGIRREQALDEGDSGHEEDEGFDRQYL